LKCLPENEKSVMIYSSVIPNLSDFDCLLSVPLSRSMIGVGVFGESTLALWMCVCLSWYSRR